MEDNTSNNNIVNLPTNSRKKSKKEEKPESSNDELKLNAHQKQALLADWLNGKSPILAHVAADTKYVLLRNYDDSVSLYKVTPSNELVSCHQKSVENTIAKAIHNHFRDMEFLQLTDSQIDGVARYWEKTTEPIEMPAKIGFADGDGLVMRRVPLVLANGPTPYWDELMGRVTNSQALMAWFGSLFVDESNRHQYVWLHGGGDDGKGSIARFFKRVLAHLYSSQVPPTFNDRFWTHGIKDARLVVFEDCNNTSFVTSGLFKMLTGGDYVRVEIKGGSVLSLLIKAKYMFLSNEKPDISSERADEKRIIYCTVSPFKGAADDKIETVLWDEGGAFLYKCLAMYAKMAPEHGRIVTDTTLIGEVVETNEERFSSFLESHFQVGPTYRCLPYIFQDIICKEFKTKKERQDFISYLERKGIKKKSDRQEHLDGQPRNMYVGIKPRSVPLTVYQVSN